MPSTDLLNRYPRQEHASGDIPYLAFTGMNIRISIGLFTRIFMWISLHDAPRHVAGDIPYLISMSMSLGISFTWYPWACPWGCPSYRWRSFWWCWRCPWRTPCRTRARIQAPRAEWRGPGRSGTRRCSRHRIRCHYDFLSTIHQRKYIIILCSRTKKVKF